MAKHHTSSCLLLLLPLLAITIQLTTCTRVLDEVAPPIDAPLPPPADPLPLPPPDSVIAPPVPAPVTSPKPTDVGVSTAATTNTSDKPLTFFMHDVFPIIGSVPLPNGATTNNNIPYLTGLGGGSSNGFGVNSGTTAGIAQTNNGDLGDGALPFVNGGNLPAGYTLQNLLFGTTTVIDDELTEGHELGSAVVGKAQGFYVASSEDGTSQTVVFTTLMGGGDYADTISFFGVHRMAAPESHVAVVGGTGKYENAGGYAAIQTVHLTGQHITDGVGTVLQISVYLS